MSLKHFSLIPAYFPSWYWAIYRNSGLEPHWVPAAFPGSYFWGSLLPDAIANTFSWLLECALVSCIWPIKMLVLSSRFLGPLQYTQSSSTSNFPGVCHLLPTLRFLITFLLELLPNDFQTTGIDNISLCKRSTPRGEPSTSGCLLYRPSEKFLLLNMNNKPISRAVCI